MNQSSYQAITSFKLKLILSLSLLLIIILLFIIDYCVLLLHHDFWFILILI